MICCIYLHAVIRVFFSVIPANAGVILNAFFAELEENCYPRECGGDPGTDEITATSNQLSPRMRG